jgi:regulator of PEP synthase PpsR (kinase-PPPase family)
MSEQLKPIRQAKYKENPKNAKYADLNNCKNIDDIKEFIKKWL